MATAVLDSVKEIAAHYPLFAGRREGLRREVAHLLALPAAKEETITLLKTFYSTRC
jgi:hypothetical protein